MINNTHSGRKQRIKYYAHTYFGYLWLIFNMRVCVKDLNLYGNKKIVS